MSVSAAILPVPPNLGTPAAGEIARRGDRLYQRTIRGQVERKHPGRLVAIDIHSGDFAVGDSALAASRDLRKQRPAAQIWLVRVGEQGVQRLGPRTQAVAK